MKRMTHRRVEQEPESSFQQYLDALANCDKGGRKLMSNDQAKTRILEADLLVNAALLLKMADCPECDGSGEVPHKETPDGYWESSRCQFCDERKKTIAAFIETPSDTFPEVLRVLREWASWYEDGGEIHDTYVDTLSLLEPIRGTAQVKTDHPDGQS